MSKFCCKFLGNIPDKNDWNVEKKKKLSYFQMHGLVALQDKALCKPAVGL